MKITVGLSAVILSLLSIHCSASIPFDGSERSFDFSRSFSIAVYVQPSVSDSIDRRLRNLIELDLITKGYHLVYINPEYVPSITGEWIGHQAAAETLIQRTKARMADLIVIARPVMESVDFTYGGNAKYYFSKTNLRMQLELTIVDRVSRKIVLARRSSEIQRAFQDDHMVVSGAYYPEPLRIFLERSLINTLAELPICSRKFAKSPAFVFPLVVMADDGYRDLFPDWKNRLILRMFYVNNIMRSQFDMMFEVKEYREWKSRFSTSLENGLNDLRIGTKNKRTFILGVTNNYMLVHAREQRSQVGLAPFLGTHAIITAQPVYPDALEWNSIEEALTIVHEFGHLFGAPHVADDRSVMHPNVESSAYLFDRTTHIIMESTRNRFFELTTGNRFSQNIATIAQAYLTAPSPQVEIISELGSIINQSIAEEVINNSTSRYTFDTLAYTYRLLSDSSLTFAALGYLAYRKHQWASAHRYFLQALQSRPEFAEAGWYVGSCSRRLGDAEAAEKMLRWAREMGMNYELDE